MNNGTVFIFAVLVIYLARFISELVLFVMGYDQDRMSAAFAMGFSVFMSGWAAYLLWVA